MQSNTSETASERSWLNFTVLLEDVVCNAAELYWIMLYTAFNVLSTEFISTREEGKRMFQNDHKVQSTPL